MFGREEKYGKLLAVGGAKEVNLILFDESKYEGGQIVDRKDILITHFTVFKNHDGSETLILMYNNNIIEMLNNDMCVMLL